MTTEAEDRAFDDYQAEQAILAYEADRLRCESMPAHDECQFCARPVCTNDKNCICPKCLDLPF